MLSASNHVPVILHILSMLVSLPFKMTHGKCTDAGSHHVGTIYSYMEQVNRQPDLLKRPMLVRVLLVTLPLMATMCTDANSSAAKRGACGKGRRRIKSENGFGHGSVPNTKSWRSRDAKLSLLLCILPVIVAPSARSLARCSRWSWRAISRLVGRTLGTGAEEEG